MTHHEDPAAWAYAALGIEPSALEDEIRAAYHRGLQSFPPDREPEKFQRIREAYDYLRDPQIRFKSLMQTTAPDDSLVEWLDDQPAPRHFTGPRPWLTAMEKGKRHG